MNQRQLEREELRRRAEQYLQGHLEPAVPSDAQSLVEDLQIHQVELEMQNQDLRQTQMELENSSNRYFMLFDQSPLPYFVLNAQQRVVDLNLAAAELLGTDRSGCTNRPLFVHVLSEDRTRLKRHLETVFESQRACDAELRIQRLDGSVRHLQFRTQLLPKDWEHGQICLAAAMDWTEQKTMTVALEASEQHHRALFESSREAILVLSPPSWKFEKANPAALRLFGVERECDLLRVRLWDWVPSHQPDGEPSAEKGLEMVERAMREGFHFFEWDARRSDGTVLHTEVLLTRMVIAGQTHLQAAIRDVTQKVQTEAAQTRLRNQLLGIQRLEMVGQLAGGIAHDFNNMLQVILGNVAIALEETTYGSNLHGQLQAVEAAAQRSAELTRQLLAFARRQPAQPRVVDLNEEIQVTLKLLRRLIGQGIEFVWKPGQEVWPVRVDPVQVGQVLTNLAVNARDAIQGTGIITVCTANVAVDEEQVSRIVDCAPGHYVRFTVQDTGRGMTTEVMSHLFEPFFTTKEVGKGTGLGLASVYGIVRQNKGFVTVESTVGQGSAFHVYLPREAAVSKFQPGLEGVDIGQGNETILLVEDEAHVLQVTRDILMHSGYRVLAVPTPEEALKLARNQEHSIDLLLSDVVMPSMNGKELKSRVQALRPGVKCLLMSGYPAEVIGGQGLLEEGVGFLPKPFAPRTLAEKIRQVLDCKVRS